MKPIQPGERRVVNIAEASFLPFTADGREVPGQSFLQLDDSQPPGVGFHIYRMAPGSSSQPHEHTSAEQFYVIQGELEDNDGHVYRPGDLVFLSRGTQHFSTTRTGCTLAVFIESWEENL
jgi:quercetin dioxygenase-like cupin family protein